MPSHTRAKSSMNMGNRSSIFISASHDKRNLWWRAFRKTILEPHAITILDSPVLDQIPEDLLRLVEDKCQDLERHEPQVVSFASAVSQGQGFASSILFPPEVLPPIDGEPNLSRCLEPALDVQTIPSPVDNSTQPLFDFPVPRPGLVSGFSPYAFEKKHLKHMPNYLTSYGCQADDEDGQLHQDRAVYSPFLLFERTYGHARHEIESAMNFCAMDGSAALKGIKLLYDEAWPLDSSRSIAGPVVFSCTLDDDLGVINHHWIGEDGKFYVAPLCKFDFRDSEHFMHFLAWIEAIEEWAAQNLLMDIREALAITSENKTASAFTKALPSPVTDMEKQEKLNRSMKTAFENIPWKGERLRNIPLGVTGTMRMRSPRTKVEPEAVITPMELNIPNTKTPETSSGGYVGTDANAPVASPGRESGAKSKPAPISLGSTSAVNTPTLRSAMKSSSSETPMALPPIPPIPASVGLPERRGSASSNHNGKSTTPMASPAISRVSTTSTSSHNALSRTQTPTTSEYRPQSKPVTLMDAMPPPRPESAKSPGPISPSYSVTSIQSKRSFMSLRNRDKDKENRLRSPTMSESAISPRSINSTATNTGIKSRFSNGLGIIKEHTRTKRGRSISDKSVPNSAKEIAIPLPTPAYDKKRFDIRTPLSAPVAAEVEESWLAVVKQKAAATAAANNNGNPATYVNSDSQNGVPTTAPPRPSTANNRVAVTAAYNAAHSLPLRQWAKSPGIAVTQTTTLTAAH